MKRLVKESIQPIHEMRMGDLLKGKDPEQVIMDVKEQIDISKMDLLIQTDEYEIYRVHKGEQLKSVFKNFGFRSDEDIFYNFYLILDNAAVGFNQVIGVRVSPDDTIYAFNAKGDTVYVSYLEERFPDL